MSPSKTSWDEEDSDSTPPSSPPLIAARGKKFDDEEDGDVLDDWENEEDSEVEREKAKKAAEAKAKADAAAKANHKSRSERIEERREATRLRQAADNDLESDEEETEYDKRQRERESEKLGDLKHAEDLFAGIGGVPNTRGEKPVTVQEGDDPSNAVDLSSLKLFNPTTAQQFLKLRETLTQLLLANSKKPQYALFMNEFAKQIVRDMNSEQIKKVASGLTTISNEKMKEEKAAEKGGKKTKAAKTKTTLNANRNNAMNLDLDNFDGGLDDTIHNSDWPAHRTVLLNRQHNPKLLQICAKFVGPAQVDAISKCPVSEFASRHDRSEQPQSVEIEAKTSPAASAHKAQTLSRIVALNKSGRIGVLGSIEHLNGGPWL